ncbi:MAG: hypothetical protein HQ521_07935 [Bacteroidetes bacterium]|nr:hypothetical protein [Bacteroidota bacterium]
MIKFLLFFSVCNPMPIIPASESAYPSAKKIVERHGGQIRFESEENIGTTYYFTLPSKGGNTNGKF